MDNQEHIKSLKEAIKRAGRSEQMIVNQYWLQQSLDIIEQQQREIERLRAALTLICHYPPHITTPNAGRYYEEMRSTANFALLTKEDQTPPTECMSCDDSGWVYDYERTGVPEQSACPECKGKEVSTDVQT